MIRTTVVALVLALFSGAPLAVAQDAPPEIRPGDPALDATPVRAGVDSLAIFVIDGEEAFGIGQYVIETSIAEGKITRSDRMLGLDDELLWGEEVVLEDGSLRPISVRSLDGSRGEVSFDGSAVVRQGVDGEETQVVRAEPAFHATALDFTLRSLPLAAGYRAAVVIIDSESLNETALPIHVEREVVVQDVNGVSSTTWEVHVDLGGAVDVYHLEQESGALIRYESAADALVMLRW